MSLGFVGIRVTKLQYTIHPQTVHC